MTALTTLAQPKLSQHVYELRMYHVNPGNMEALKARFADHVDALLKKHNMKSLGYWTRQDAPDPQNLLVQATDLTKTSME